MKEIFSKPFMSNADIITVLNCSACKASRIKSKIRKQLELNGKKLMTNDIPTKAFLDFMCYIE
jgi:hypothetical protein